MNSVKFVTILLVLILSITMLLAEPDKPENDNKYTIESLYNRILQKEFSHPILLPEHQLERKAQRSPSLRLRFGRTDPELVSASKRLMGIIRQKPIRSPSLRLRFGKRGPMMSYFPTNQIFEEIEPSEEVESLASLYSSDEMYNREMRAPTLRLRFGRGEKPTSEEIEARAELASNVMSSNENQFDRDERSPKMRLRFGRSIKKTTEHI